MTNPPPHLGHLCVFQPGARLSTCKPRCICRIYPCASSLRDFSFEQPRCVNTITMVIIVNTTRRKTIAQRQLSGATCSLLHLLLLIRINMRSCTRPSSVKANITPPRGPGSYAHTVASFSFQHGRSAVLERPAQQTRRCHPSCRAIRSCYR